MEQQNRKWIMLVAFLLLAAFLIRFSSIPTTTYLFKQGLFELLNFLTQRNINQPFGYYLGQMHQLYFGPIFILLTGIAFLIFAWIFLREKNIFVFASAVFGYLLLTRFEVLFFPPYGDSVSGPFAEAFWLVNHSFNYMELARQPGFAQGGPKVYLFSIYPTFQAILIKIIPGSKLFLVINHLIVFVLGAFAVSLFRQIALKVYDKEVSLLLSILFISFPLFQSQVEGINMEMPLVFFSMLSLYYLINKRLWLAAIMAVCATLIKGVGIIICGTVFAVCLFLFFFGQGKHRFQASTLWAGLLVMSFVALKAFLSMFILYEKGNVALVGFFQGWKENSKLPVLYMYFASLFIFLIFYVYEKLKGHSHSFFDYLKKHYVASIIFLCAFAWFALFLQSYGAQYRYRLLLTPLNLFCVFYVLTLFIRSKRFVQGSLILLIGFSFFCSYGFLYKIDPINPHEPVLHSALERTLEYRNDLQVQILVTKKIEDQFSSYLIGAPFTIAQTLAFPKLGYVTKDLDVMIYRFPCTYGGIKMFEGLEHINVLKTIWIGYETIVDSKILSIIHNYPVASDDLVVERIVRGKRKATLFQGGMNIEKYRRIRLKLYEIYLKQGQNS